MGNTRADDAYLTPTELVAYSGISRRALFAYMHVPDHPLPFYRVGNRIRVRRSEFDLWMKTYRTTDSETKTTLDKVMKGL